MNAKQTVLAVAFVGIVSAGAGGCSLWSSKEKPAAATPPGKVTDRPVDRSAENQTAELRALGGPVVRRTGDEINMMWEADALFDFDSAMLKKEATATLDTLATILNRYPDTRIVVTGYTDTEGTEDFNFKLSKRRAASIKDYLVEIGVSPSRLDAFGLGPKQPIAPNDTDEGRRCNKRIEITIRPNPPPDTNTKHLK